MIYKNSYFIKEIRQSNIENRISIRNGLFFGVFTALLAYLLHIALLNLKGTVVAQTFPYITQEDCFSPIYTFVRVFTLFCILYFLLFFEHISLTEIRSNRWYLLAKMGYSTKMMVTVKTMAQLISLLLTYIIGFAGTLGAAVLSNNTYTFEYLPALFFAGVVEIVFLCPLSTVLSLLNRFRSVFYSRCCIVIAEAGLLILSEFTGYRSALSSKSFIAEHGMFSPFSISVSIYFVVVLALIVLFTIVSLYKAKAIAMYYDEPLENTDFSLPTGRILARLDHRNGMFYIFRKSRFKIRSLAYNVVFILFLCSVLLFTFLLNLFRYYTNEYVTVSIGEKIYCMSDRTIQKSDSVNPLVNINDFLVFKAVDDNDSFDNEELVLVKSDSGPEIQLFSSQVKRTDVIGKLDSIHRWLGAAILLVNNTEGRILFFVLPLLTLLLYRNIRKLLARKPVAIE